MRTELALTKSEGFESFSFDLGLCMPLKMYFALVVLLFTGFFGFEELLSKKSYVGKQLRSMLGHHDMH